MTPLLVALHYALELLGIAPVHEFPDLSSPGCPVDLWVEQIMLKKQGKYDTAGGIWDKAEQWDRVLGRYAAVVDTPGHMFVAELARAYPEAKVVLTVRDSPETWVEGYRGSIYDRNLRLERSPSYQIRQYWRRITGREGGMAKVLRALRFGDGPLKEPELWWYTQHLAHVRKYVPADRLLAFNLKDGWGPLCEF
jgi:hypothetical protein